MFSVLQKRKKTTIWYSNVTKAAKSTVLASTVIDVKKPIQLQVNGDGDNIQFNYSVNKTDFVNLGGKLSTDILTTNVAGGFTGAFVGLYATINNDIVPQ